MSTRNENVCKELFEEPNIVPPETYVVLVKNVEETWIFPDPACTKHNCPCLNRHGEIYLKSESKSYEEATCFIDEKEETRILITKSSSNQNQFDGTICIYNEELERWDLMQCIQGQKREVCVHCGKNQSVNELRFKTCTDCDRSEHPRVLPPKEFNKE